MNDDATERRPILTLVIDRRCCALPIEQAVEAAVRGGVDWIQIRERELEAAALLALARQVRKAARRGAEQRRIRLLINRRVDIALALPAQGAHLGFDAVLPETARALLGSAALLGVSTHAPSQVKAAAAAGADYAHLAPIHAPLSKAASREPLGIDAVRKAAAHGIPVFAQGGVEAQHCTELVRAGAAGIAVTGAILMSNDPREAAARLRTALDT